MKVDFRPRWFQWPVQCLLLLCLLILPSGTAWALPQSDELESPSEPLIMSVMHYYCIQTGAVIAELIGEDVDTDLARATLPFALIGIDGSFLDGDELPNFMPDTPIAEGEELCVVSIPAEVLGLSDSLALEILELMEIYAIVSLTSGEFGLGIAPPIELLPDPPEPSYDGQHQVFRYLCPLASPIMKSLFEKMGDDLADRELRSHIAWAGADIDGIDIFDQPVELAVGTELCVIISSVVPAEALILSWPHFEFFSDANPTLLDQPLPPLPARVPGDGTWIVGQDVAPGLYRSTREFQPQQTTQEGLPYYGEACDFRLLRGFGGRDQDLIGGRKQAYARVIVQLGGEVRGLATKNCGAWERLDDKALPISANGTRRIGTDMGPGLLRSRHNNVSRDANPSPEDGQCTWLILNDFLWADAYTAAGVSSSVWGQDRGTSVVVEIPATAAGFHSEFCEAWVRVE